jgi:hypothetical protein
MSELLKAAIADAKAVRATALANARAALEEAFTPKLQSMLSAKLQQEINDDETEQAPVEAPAPVADVPVEAPAPIDAAPAAPEADLPPAPMPDEAAPAAPAPFGDDEESLDEFQPLGAGNPDAVNQNQVGLFETEKSNSLSKSPKGAKTEDPQGASKEVSKGFKKDDKNVTKGEPKASTTSATASSDYKKTASGGKEIKRAVSASGDQDGGVGVDVTWKKGDTTSTKPLKEVDDVDVEVDDESLDEILKELEAEVNQASAEMAEPAAAPAAAPAPVAAFEAAGAEEEINLDELLESDDKKDDDDKEEKKDKDDDDKPAFLKENISLKAELEEYRNTVKFLRDRINEVNLLNAKLLYTNKLFKSSSMTNEQKLRVIESFDLTKSVREAKLVFATLSESLNFGAKAPAPKVAPKSTTVKSITEGLASKTVASTKPTQPALLSEGAQMASRFQKLAGINKK